MRRLILCVLALSLVACDGTSPSATEAVSTPAPSASAIPDTGLVSAKAMYAAEVLYNVPASAYVFADSNGLLNASEKETIKKKLITLYDLLQVARVDKESNNLANFTFVVNNMEIIKSDICEYVRQCKEPKQ